MRVSFPYGERIYTFDHPGLSDRVGREQQQNKTFDELPLLELLADRLGSRALVFDVGAHVGNHSVYLERYGASSVFAFEPNQRAFRCLVQNTEGYAVRSFHCALGAPPIGVVSVMDTDEADSSRASVRYVEAYAPFHVPVMPLDLWGIPFGPELIKIDVCGFEMEVLRGAIGTLRKHRPLLAIANRPRAEQSEIRAFLDDFGYVGSDKPIQGAAIWEQG